MGIGIPRGYFYYDYMGFLKELFGGDRELIIGEENSEETLTVGSMVAVDEACVPIKLLAGQVERLSRNCDVVLMPRIAKDIRGNWLCPKLIGVTSLMPGLSRPEKVISSGPIDFSNKRSVKKEFLSMWKQLGLRQEEFNRRFSNAYSNFSLAAFGLKNQYYETSWEMTPVLPGPGEIILPNMRKVLLLGHSYTVYDRFLNGRIIEKLDNRGIECITGRGLGYMEMENYVRSLKLVKKPFWEAFVRTAGTAISQEDKVDGIIYLSSFSCGTDSFIIEMIRDRMSHIPMMVLKLDEQRGEAGYDTRIEAFCDMLEGRNAS